MKHAAALCRLRIVAFSDRRNLFSATMYLYQTDKLYFQQTSKSIIMTHKTSLPFVFNKLTDARKIKNYLLPCFLLPFLILFCSILVNAQSTQECYDLPDEEPPVYPAPMTLCQNYGGLPANVTLNGNTNSQSQGTTGFSNIVVHINGEFTVNSHFSFTNCIVKMEPGSKIKSVNGQTLTISGSYLFACNNMWAGIEVGTNCLLTMSSSFVEDAQFAIFPALDSYIELEGNTFNRNWVGLRAIAKFKVQSFRANTFKHSGTNLNVPYPGQVPAPQGSKSFAGMWLENAGTLTLNPTTIGQVNLFT